jgi:hypothetical protein
MANIALQTPIARSAPTETQEAPADCAVEPRLSARATAQSIIGFWVFYFFINTVRMAVIEAHGQIGMLPRRLAVSLIGILLTTVLCLVLRRFEGKSIRTLVSIAFLASLPVSFAYASVNFLFFYVIHPADSELQEMHKENVSDKLAAWHSVADSALNWYFFVLAWAVLYIALSYAGKVRFAERNAALYRTEAQSAQLRALRYQINPHFLFNTLNSLSTLVLRRQSDEAERMIINLSNFFRTSLTTDPTEDVALIDEIRMQRLYLDIEQIRFPERLKVAIDVPAEIENAAVPGMLLQPIVENAIKYGVARSISPVTVTIRARAAGGRLDITIEDDGGVERAGDLNFETMPTGSGVGLRNVCDRLMARFGEAADCQYGPRAEGGFRVRLAMPFKAHTAAE